ncbi:hypothetical protein [Sphaerisporangium fuscum]|uniref:hypothetical protein n=1 Tax=Sphaerisporangium fuscum TaxID=2835868 RepID=UPI001BDC5E9F|nr:hypothetical protein [Sphaerisporangium fuscum]
MALVLTSVPYVVFLFADTESYGFTSFGERECPGWELQFELSSYTWFLYVVPTPVVVAVAFAGWGLLARKGFRRWGRALGWAAGIQVALYGAVEFALAGFDAVAADGCGRQWSIFLDAGSARWHLYNFLIAFLIFLAVRVRHAGPPRRGPFSRTTAALVACLVPAVLTTMDAAPAKVTRVSSKACEPWEIARYVPQQPKPEQREIAFICTFRLQPALPRSLAHAPDQELILFGHHLCGVMLRGGLQAEVLQEDWEIAPNSPELTQSLAYLCPEVDRRRRQEAEQSRQEEERFATTAERRCASSPPHRPLIRPLVRGRAAMWAEWGGLTAYEAEGPSEDQAAFENAFGNHLAGSAPGALAILTADEAMHVCVTVEAYGKRPPVEVKGWDKVVEIPYRSTTGHLVLEDDGTARLPDLAIRGRGGYRVRVHERGAEEAMARDGDAREEFLVIVYPGAAKRTTVLKKGRG